jgi:hypothetical protein
MFSIRFAVGFLALVMAFSVPCEATSAQQTVQPAQSVLSSPAAIAAQPGAINYIEGQASVGNRPIDAKSIGTVDLSAGQILTTETGKAELLLVPGVFLRIGDHSAVKMVSPGLSDTRVELVRGEATIEVAEIHNGNHLSVDERGIFDY